MFFLHPTISVTLSTFFRVGVRVAMTYICVTLVVTYICVRLAVTYTCVRLAVMSYRYIPVSDWQLPSA